MKLNMRSALVGSVLSIAMLTLCATAAAPASAAECSNEAIREEQHTTSLPECRGYELVSPLGTTAYGEGNGALAASGGGAIAWFTNYPLEGSSGGFYELSRREADGWATESITPATATDSGEYTTCPPSFYFSDGLAHAVLEIGPEIPQGAGYCGEADPMLVSGEPKGAQNLLLRDSGTGAYQLVNVTPEGVAPANAYFENASADFSRVFFEEEAALTPNAPAGMALYEWVDGVVHLVSVLPGGAPVSGVIVDAYRESHTEDPAGHLLHSVSVDGRRAFFEANGSLYVRVNPEAESEAAGTPTTAQECGVQACTIQLDASRAGGGGGGGSFLAAAADGSRVFFTDAAGKKLTSDTQQGSSANLYEYNLQTGALTDLTAGVAAANVLGVSGIGGDGSYLYFVAGGDLTGGQQNSQGATAVAPASGTGSLTYGDYELTGVTTSSGALQVGMAITGPGILSGTMITAVGNKTLTLSSSADASTTTTFSAAGANLYVWHNGAPAFIATLNQEDFKDWEQTHSNVAVAPSGDYLAFDSVEQLTGYDNAPAQPSDCSHLQYRLNGESQSGPCQEVYEYGASAAAPGPACVSCEPSGAAPIGPSQAEGSDSLLVTFGPNQTMRSVLDDGRVFFDSSDALVSRDINGTQDSYEYAEGAPHLISSGRGSANAYFLDASEHGEDVFFRTDESLVGADTDNQVSLYDARVGGGYPEPATASSSCSGEGCHPALPAAPTFAAPASVSFSGRGNRSASHAVRKASKRHGRARKRRLRRALRHCARRFPHSRHRRRMCKNRVRQRLAGKAAHRRHRHHRRGGQR